MAWLLRACVCVCVRACACACVCLVCACVCACLRVCVLAPARALLCVRARARARVCVCVCVCVCVAWQFVIQAVIFAVTLENDVKFIVISNQCLTNISTFSLLAYCNSSIGSYFGYILEAYG